VSEVKQFSVKLSNLHAQYKQFQFVSFFTLHYILDV